MKVKVSFSKKTITVWCLIHLTFPKFSNERVCLNGYHYLEKVLHWSTRVMFLLVGQMINLQLLSSGPFKMKKNEKTKYIKNKRIKVH